MHLHEFITSNRDELIARTRAKVAQRPWPSVSPEELENGIPLFLTQLAETLRLENTEAPFSATAIGSSATKHGGDLLAMGFTVSQVVHDYGDVLPGGHGARRRAEGDDQLGRVPHPEPLPRYGHRGGGHGVRTAATGGELRRRRSSGGGRSLTSFATSSTRRCCRSRR